MASSVKQENGATISVKHEYSDGFELVFVVCDVWKKAANELMRNIGAFHVLV